MKKPTTILQDAVLYTMSGCRELNERLPLCDTYDVALDSIAYYNLEHLGNHAVFLFQDFNQYLVKRNSLHKQAVEHTEHGATVYVIVDVHKLVYTFENVPILESFSTLDRENSYCDALTYLLANYSDTFLLIDLARRLGVINNVRRLSLEECHASNRPRVIEHAEQGALVYLSSTPHGNHRCMYASSIDFSAPYEQCLRREINLVFNIAFNRC